MPVRVSFSGPVPPRGLDEIRAALEAIECGQYDRWDVVFSPGNDAGEWRMAIDGPDQHRRVYRIPATQDTESARFEPRYLAALLGAEIRSFPSCPPFAFALAVAELARQGIAVDPADAFRGRVAIEGITVSNERLMDLYRRGLLRAESVRQHLRASSGS